MVLFDRKISRLTKYTIKKKIERKTYKSENINKLDLKKENMEVYNF